MKSNPIQQSKFFERICIAHNWNSALRNKRNKSDIMNFFRLAPSQDYTKRVEIIGDREEDVSNDSYGGGFSDCENPSKKAKEMEDILGNALAITERTGSLRSLTRSGTIDLGRRIATMTSKEDRAGGILDAHRTNNDPFNHISRSSSLASLDCHPTFVKVEKEDRLMMSYDSSEESDEEQQSEAPMPPQQQSEAQMPPRSWTKLRHEVNEELRAKHEEDKNNSVRRRSTQIIGEKIDRFRKKIDTLVENVKERTDKNNKNSKGCAKDYDVEVELQDKKFFWDRQPPKIFWDRQPSIKKWRGKTSKSKLGSRNSNNEKENSRNSKTDAEDNSLVEETIVERNSDVVIKSHETTHTGNVLFEALEVACCHSIDGGTLDLITDMVPPQM